MTTATRTLRQIGALRWNPTLDLAVVALSWMLVVAALYTATFVVGATAWGGMAYFALYAVVGATLFGLGIPLFWTTVVRRRPIADLGITVDRLGLSVGLQVLLAALLFAATLARTPVPPLANLLPLIALALAIGFFEAVFWRGWVLLRLEESFGVIPAILLSSALYSVYHIGYGMPAGEMLFLFFIGVMFAVVFRITKSVFILWPLFQPMGQLITLVKDGLSLPVLATLGFVDVLALMVLLIWLAARHYKKHGAPAA